MALAYSVKDKDIGGRKRLIVADITLDALYVATGWALDKGKLGFYREISSMNILTHNAGAYTFELIRGSSPKLKALQPAVITGATAAGGTTGTLATDEAGAETVMRAQSVPVSTTVRGPVRRVEAAASDAFLNGKVVTAEFTGW